MSVHSADTNIRPGPDKELVDIARYVTTYEIQSKEAFETARYCLMDTLGCGLLALRYPECTRHLGPLVDGTVVPNGARVPGTRFILDPIKAAFDIGTMIRWLDFNDTWLAAEWGHPSDNLGGILAIADYLSLKNISENQKPLTMRDVLTAMIKAHEVQGIMALENSFNRLGIDHVVLVKVASTAVITQMLGGSEGQIADALSHAWVDGQSLRTYRHAPNTGSRKSWAAGDATSRAARLALIVMNGEMGLPSVLSAKTWGFYDATFKGNRFTFPMSYGSYVMEHILFKISFPAEFHAQTAVECAIQLHDEVKDRIGDIDRIDVNTQEPAVRIISKDGPLHNYADRDHCLQYMISIPLLFGELTADHYKDEVAKDPRIDSLREKMRVVEDKQYTEDYYDPEKRAIPNALQIFFKDGSSTERVEVKYPIGHRRRRSEGIPVLKHKFKGNLKSRFTGEQVDAIFDLCNNHDKLEATPVNKFMDMLTI